MPDWVPGAGFKRFAKRARARLFRAEDKLYAMVKEQVVGRPPAPLLTLWMTRMCIGEWDGPAFAGRGPAAEQPARDACGGGDVQAAWYHVLHRSVTRDAW